jgi:tRNA pseudouridine55 synthase
MDNLVDGILVLDKPGGMTSHDVVVSLRRLLGGARVGHAGTLDPNATGVLIALLGRATKVSRFLMGLDKEYVFKVEFGVETDTLDKWGRVVNTAPTTGIGPEMVFDAAAKFRGRYQQIAPALSALKHRGVPLYKLARQGLSTPLKTRVVEIREFEVLKIDMPEVTIRVVCSSGTYVRSLARDMGRYLGCGGSVSSLRRIRIGAFPLEVATPLGDLVEGRRTIPEILVPIERGLAHLPRISLTNASVEGIRAGRQPSAADLDGDQMAFDGDYVALTDQQGSIVGIAVRSENAGAGLRTERVL